MPDLSIVIPSWNAAALLRDCLQSIRDSTGGMATEIIVVDNGSSDGSADMVAAEFPDVTLIRERKNLGFARANNIGLKSASSPYVAFLNSDVVVHPGCFQTLVGFLSCNLEVGLVGPQIVGKDGMLQRTCRRLPTLWNTLCRVLALDSAFPQFSSFAGREMRNWSHDTEAQVESLNGCFWLARSAAITDVGPLDERFFFYAEDVDWCKRFRDTGWKIMFVPTATATHFGGGSSTNAPVHYHIELLRANLAYWRKHHGRRGQVVYWFLCLVHESIRLMGRGLSVLLHSRGNNESSQKFRRSLASVRWLLGGDMPEPMAAPSPTKWKVAPVELPLSR